MTSEWCILSHFDPYSPLVVVLLHFAVFNAIMPSNPGSKAMASSLQTVIALPWTGMALYGEFWHPKGAF